jgi:hypothetical protein
MRKSKRNYKSEILDIIKTKDWDRAKKSDKNLYQYVCRYRDTDENCKTIWEHMSHQNRDFESEISKIIETENWDRARHCNDKSLYQYVCRYKDTNENCRIIWEHISQRSRDYESEVLEIIRTKDWDRAKGSNDRNLYLYIRCHKDTDEDCRTIWEHMSHQNKDFESEVLEIIRTKDWDRARCSKDRNLYRYIRQYRDIDKNCKIIWKHIKTHHTIKDYLQYYFEQGKLKGHNTLSQWFNREIRKGNQSCIDVKNLIVASETYKDPVALETLGLIKNHLEKEDI